METIDLILFILILFAALTCGLIGGIFYGFSTFIYYESPRTDSYRGRHCRHADD